MSAPKLKRLLDTVAERLAAISPGAGFYTDAGAKVLRDRREPAVDCLPCVAVFSGERTVTERRGERAACDLAINVIAYASAEDTDFERLGIELLADIQRAVELSDVTLGGLVRDQYGLAFVSDEIFVPEIGANAVGARVTYTAPHVRRAGDPEIA